MKLHVRICFTSVESASACLGITLSFLSIRTFHTPTGYLVCVICSCNSFQLFKLFTVIVHTLKICTSYLDRFDYLFCKMPCHFPIACRRGDTQFVQYVTATVFLQHYSIFSQWYHAYLDCVLPILDKFENISAGVNHICHRNP